MVAAAVIGSAVVGGVVSSSAASKAAKAQSSGAGQAADANKYAADIQKQIYEQQREDFAPWRTVGQSALGQLSDLYGLSSPYAVTGSQTNDNSTNISNLEARLAGVNGQLSSATSGSGSPGGNGRRWMNGGGNYQAATDVSGLTQQQQDLTSQLAAARGAGQGDPNAGLSTAGRQQAAMDKFFTSPNYNFTLNEGLKSLDRYSAANGGFASGNTLKAANDYSQSMASNEFGNYQNTLMSMSGLGQNAANSTAAAGSNYSGNVGAGAANLGNAYMAAGNATASGYLRQSQAINQGLGNIASYYTMSNLMGK